MTATTLNAHHELIGITAFDDQHRKPVEGAEPLLRGSFALGLLLLGILDEDEEEEPTEPAE